MNFENIVDDFDEIVELPKSTNVVNEKISENEIDEYEVDKFVSADPHYKFVKDDDSELDNAHIEYNKLYKKSISEKTPTPCILVEWNYIKDKQERESSTTGDYRGSKNYKVVEHDKLIDYINNTDTRKTYHCMFYGPTKIVVDYDHVTEKENISTLLIRTDTIIENVLKPLFNKYFKGEGYDMPKYSIAHNTRCIDGKGKISIRLVINNYFVKCVCHLKDFIQNIILAGEDDDLKQRLDVQPYAINKSLRFIKQRKLKDYPMQVYEDQKLENHVPAYIPRNCFYLDNGAECSCFNKYEYDGELVDEDRIKGCKTNYKNTKIEYVYAMLDDIKLNKNYVLHKRGPWVSIVRCLFAYYLYNPSKIIDIQKICEMYCTDASGAYNYSTNEVEDLLRSMDPEKNMTRSLWNILKYVSVEKRESLDVNYLSKCIYLIGMGDKGIARMFLAVIDYGLITYVTGNKITYYLYNKETCIWDKKTKNNICEIISDVIQKKCRILSKNETDEERKKIYNKLYTKIGNTNKITSVSARVFSATEKNADNFQLDRYTQEYLPIRSGMINLKTKEIIKRKRNDYVTYYLDVGIINDGRKINKVDNIFKSICCGDEEYKNYLKCIIGSSLVGVERSIYVCYGQGANGKSTLFEKILDRVLGNFSTSIAKSLIMQANNSGSKPNPELLHLKGRRAIRYSELSENTKIDIEQLKSITGQDKIQGRGMYSDDIVSIVVCAVVFIITNEIPNLNMQSDAMKSRVKFLPFNQKYTDKVEDYSYYEYIDGKEQLKKTKTTIASSEEIDKLDVDAIFTYLLDGCYNYFKGAFNEPKCCKVLKDEVCGDNIKKYLDTYKVVADEKGSADFMKCSETYADYCMYCNNQNVASKSVFDNKFKIYMMDKITKANIIINDAKMLRKKISHDYWRYIKKKTKAELEEEHNKEVDEQKNNTEKLQTN